MRKSFKRDVEMWESLKVSKKRIIARDYKITMGALDSWLTECRKRLRDAQWYINQRNNIIKNDSRMRRLLSSASEEGLDLFDEEEEEEE